ncbi:phosphoribosylanthranilate isomerase [Marinobacterium litorale]|uniref:phosphoribosylanthranilate isomerase n=1 Tax=Marinobacterium litorale TaxID=404770 RepID=UPI00041DE92B|nr:phosphoribosylanthranilate isomerase [Marinobacterium litorale]
MTRVKICGISRLEDAQVAVEAGADAIGFVFYEASPRAVTPEQARDIIARLPAFVTTTGLFVNPEPELVEHALTAGIDLIQFHGDEQAGFCESFGRPWIKALRMKEGVDIAGLAAQYALGRGILLDAYRPGVPGGTGETFDWERIPAHMRSKIILAGGLTPDNVAQAVKQVQPYAVDVSGGVEQSKGIKDAECISAFMSGVRLGDSERHR